MLELFLISSLFCLSSYAAAAERFGIRSNVSLKLLELETSNLIQFLAVRSAILATAWLLLFH